MSRRSRLARTALTLALAACGAALTTVACGGGDSPSGPTPTTPAVRTVSPASGTSFGGTEVTINGERFVAGATVTFGGAPGTNIAVENATTIRATTPAHATGPVDVAVSGSNGSGILAQAFTFVAPGGSNTPPVIRSVTAKGRKASEPAGFADIGETIDVTAIVEDAETALDKLTYQWTATIGAVNGTGPVVTWTAPASASTPTNVTLTLNVLETYKAPDATGLPVDKENKATGTATVALHNSAKEVSDMARDFLEKFSVSSIPVDTVLRDFSTNCKGYQDERNDVVANRKNFVIQSYSVGTPATTVNFGGQCTLFSDRYRPADACSLVPVQWTSKVLATGKVETTKGTDQVTGIFDGTRWWLCDSDYLGTATSSAMRAFKK